MSQDNRYERNIINGSSDSGKSKLLQQFSNKSVRILIKEEKPDLRN